MASTSIIERTRGDAKLVVREFRRERGKIIVDAEVWSHGELTHAAQFPILDQRESAHFILFAGRKQADVDWQQLLMEVTAEVREALDAAESSMQAPPDPAPIPWKSGKDLVRRTFPQVEEVVPGILPVGVTVLASSPKLGKSRFMLDISLAVATGGKALGGIDVTQGDVLYLCLEDSEQLLQERLLGMLQGQDMPDTFDYASEWRRFDEGGIAGIERWLASHPKAKLVVVDIFQRVKPIGKGNRNAYELDYAASSPILDLGNKYLGVSITIVHHANRNRNVSDPMDLINGSNGILGGADGGMVMRAVPGHQGQATLEIAHRRLKVPPPKLVLKTDPLTGGWILQGNAHHMLLSAERQQVIDVIRQAGKPLSCQVIASNLGKKVEAIRKCVQRMLRSDHLVIAERGLYDVPPMPNARVLGVLDVSDAPDVPGVLGDPEPEWERVGQGGHPHLTDDEPMENSNRGQVGQGGHRLGSEPVPNIDQDSAELVDAADVAGIDDEPPDDLRFTRRVQQVAETVRPIPSRAPSFDAPAALDEADATGQPSDTTGQYEEVTI